MLNLVFILKFLIDSLRDLLFHYLAKAKLNPQDMTRLSLPMLMSFVYTALKRSGVDFSHLGVLNSYFKKTASGQPSS